MSRGISTISNPCQVRDSLTGEGIAGATVHVRNITRVDRYGHMDNDIGHDIKSGEKNIGKKHKSWLSMGVLSWYWFPTSRILNVIKCALSASGGDYWRLLSDGEYEVDSRSCWFSQTYLNLFSHFRSLSLPRVTSHRPSWSRWEINRIYFVFMTLHCCPW